MATRGLKIEDRRQRILCQFELVGYPVYRRIVRCPVVSRRAPHMGFFPADSASSHSCLCLCLCLCLTKVRQVSFATNLWIRNSITVMAVVMEEVLIAGMQHWRAALRMSFNHTVGSRYLLNRRYLLSPVLSTDRLNTLGWILSLTLTVQSCIWMSLLLLVSAASTKPILMAKRAEKSKFDRYPHINLVPFILETQVGLAHTPGNSSATYCETLITHHQLSETLGPPSKVSSTVPSPNNNSRPPSRDSQ